MSYGLGLSVTDAFADPGVHRGDASTRSFGVEIPGSDAGLTAAGPYASASTPIFEQLFQNTGEPIRVDPPQAAAQPTQTEPAAPLQRLHNQATAVGVDGIKNDAQMAHHQAEEHLKSVNAANDALGTGAGPYNPAFANVAGTVIDVVATTAVTAVAAAAFPVAAPAIHGLGAAKSGLDIIERGTRGAAQQTVESSADAFVRAGGGGGPSGDPLSPSSEAAAHSAVLEAEEIALADRNYAEEVIATHMKRDQGLDISVEEMAEEADTLQFDQGQETMALAAAELDISGFEDFEPTPEFQQLAMPQPGMV